MEIGTNTVLITGGASGIGLALAERFLKAGSQVIVCGRREAVLRQVKAQHPALHIRVCDVETPGEREELARWAVAEFPRLNVLLNNAGIQRSVSFTEQEDWDQTHREVAINLEAPIHLCRLFIPHLVTQPRPAILNVTSGLSFVPKTNIPIYCATKAALHSFTLSLRHQLARTPVQVIEIIPPAVNTDLGGPGLHTYGIAVEEFADAAMAGLTEGKLEIAYGFSAETSRASRAQLDEAFHRMNP